MTEYQEEAFKRYKEELHRVLALDDSEALKEHMRLWKIPISSSEIVFEAMRHKSITAIPELPLELRQRSKKWLDEHNMHSFDDGDLK